MVTVKLSHITKRLGGEKVVADLSLLVREGEFLSLLGPSGCGKTTTIRIIAGLAGPDEGRVEIADLVVADRKLGIFVPPEKRNIGMVFQSYAIWPFMSVFDNVAYPLAIQKKSKEEREARVTAILKKLEMERFVKRLPHELSGGQQQRVALARALVMEPAVLLLDEPLSNLDAKLRLEMRAVLKELHQSFTVTIVYVTHDQAEAFALSDRIAIMQKGEILQLGTQEDIVNHPSSDWVAEFIKT